MTFYNFPYHELIFLVNCICVICFVVFFAAICLNCKKFHNCFDFFAKSKAATVFNTTWLTFVVCWLFVKWWLHKSRSDIAAIDIVEIFIAHKRKQKISLHMKFPESLTDSTNIRLYLNGKLIRGIAAAIYNTKQRHNSLENHYFANSKAFWKKIHEKFLGQCIEASKRCKALNFKGKCLLKTIFWII